MGNISVSLPSDGTAADVSDYNNPINTIVNEFNGNIDNTNIKAGAAIDGTKIASNSIPTAAIADGAVTAAKTGFGGDYSLSEVNTGFKWIDGKDIYKRSVSFGALPNATTKNVAHGITGIDNIVELEFWSTDGTNFLFTNHSAGGGDITTFATKTNVSANTSSTNRSSYTTTYFTLYYTKV